jgi:hypothetical protein
MRTDGCTDGRTDMTKLTVAFRNFTKASKKKSCQGNGRRFQTSDSPGTMENNGSQNKEVNCVIDEEISLIMCKERNGCSASCVRAGTLNVVQGHKRDEFICDFATKTGCEGLKTLSCRLLEIW